LLFRFDPIDGEFCGEWFLWSGLEPGATDGWAGQAEELEVQQQEEQKAQRQQKEKGGPPRLWGRGGRGAHADGPCPLSRLYNTT